MSERVKLTGSIGRGVHYLKKLLRVDGQPSFTYKLETDLDVQLTLLDRDIGQVLNVICEALPAGGPLLKVGEVQKDFNKVIKYIDLDQNNNILVTFEDDN